jgi:hypothetical protein
MALVRLRQVVQKAVAIGVELLERRLAALAVSQVLFDALHTAGGKVADGKRSQFALRRAV